MKMILFRVIGIFLMVLSIPFYPFIYNYSSNDINLIPMIIAVTLGTAGIMSIAYSFARSYRDRNPHVVEESKSNWERLNRNYRERNKDLDLYVERYPILYEERTYPYLRRKYPWLGTFIVLFLVIISLVSYILIEKGISSNYEYITLPFMVIMPFIGIGIIGISLNYGKFYERIYIFEDGSSFIVTFNHIRVQGNDIEKIIIYDDWKVVELIMKNDENQGFPYYVRKEAEEMILILQMLVPLIRKKDNDMSVHRKYGHPM